MPINRNLNIPVRDRAPAAVGRAPDRDPALLERLVTVWNDSMADDRDRPHAIADRRFRASWAGVRCDAALWDHINNTPKSNPASIADHWRMNLGTMVHNAMDSIVKAAFPGSDYEVKVDLQPYVDGSGTIDLVLWNGLERTCVELKTINGYAFKLAATGFKGAPQGPKIGHVAQAALTASALGAEKMVIAYLSMELVSPYLDGAVGITSEVSRFAAQWTYDRDDIRRLSVAEEKRVRAVLDAMERPAPVIRDGEVPDGAVVEDPGRRPKAKWIVRAADGSITQAGETHHCSYCSYRDHCVTVVGHG